MALIIRESIGYMVGQLRDNSGFDREQDYLWDMSEDMGEDMEFCPTEIRCDWNACTWSGLRELYSNLVQRDLVDDSDLLEALNDKTLVAGYTDEWVVFKAF